MSQPMITHRCIHRLTRGG